MSKRISKTLTSAGVALFMLAWVFLATPILLLTSLLASLVYAIFPAWRAARLEPVKTQRYE
jgi:ABC-type lipoprotein release transport system permease subunit